MEARDDGNTRYFRTSGGSIGEVNDSHPGAGGMPEGAVEITEEEFRLAYDSWENGVGEHVAGLREAEAELAEETYEALRAAGISEGVARRLSGHASSPAR